MGRTLICFYLSMLTALLPLGSAAAADGTFSLFRWNTGYRAEPVPVLQQQMSANEFRRLVAEKKLPTQAETYRGCYLAHYEARTVSKGRSLASVSPKSEIYRICVPGND